jgi:hypothetical protein
MDFPENIEVPNAITLFEDRVGELQEKGKRQRITEYCALSTEEDIKMALYNNLPVIMVMPWYSDIRVTNGIMFTECANKRGYHCMVIYGWDENGWKVQNSWGNDWGDNGRVIIPYHIRLTEKWSIIDTQTNQPPLNLDIKKPCQSKVGKIVAKIVNKILNFLFR